MEITSDEAFNARLLELWERETPQLSFSKIAAIMTEDKVYGHVRKSKIARRRRKILGITTRTSPIVACPKEAIRALWDEGLSCHRIAERLNAEGGYAPMTKNKVRHIGNRMGLDPRKHIKTGIKLQKHTKNHPTAEVEPATIPAEEAAPVVRRVVATSPNPGQCQWPIGHPGTEGFRFCCERVQTKRGENNTMVYRPYCAEHCAIAYLKTPGIAA